MNQRNLGPKVTVRDYNWLDLVHKAWGSEFVAPDHGTYEFSNGRKFDSTDRGTTGVYNPNLLTGVMLDNEQYPDMPAYLLVDTTGAQLDQG